MAPQIRAHRVFVKGPTPAVRFGPLLQKSVPIPTPKRRAVRIDRPLPAQRAPVVGVAPYGWAPDVNSPFRHAPPRAPLPLDTVHGALVSFRLNHWTPPH